MTKYAIALAAVLFAANAGAMELTAPHMPPTPVTEDGALQEAWGTVALCCPAAGEPDVVLDESSPYAAAVVTWESDGATVTASMYRAPIWPAGVDVLEVRLSNPLEEPASVPLELRLPDGVRLGERLGHHGGRPVVALPEGAEPVRETREWGCAQGGVMRDWGRPAVACDPAFENIRVGYGAPIIYQLPAPAGGKGTVAVGLLESHWGMTGQRVLDVFVEGGGMQTVDPVAQGGRHMPHLFLFKAEDHDGDGCIEVVSAAAETARDQNAILNALWVFPTNVYVDAHDVVQGARNGRALCYVDAGGENDPSYYKEGKLAYEVALAPKEEKTLLFLAACPGGGALPDPEEMTWTPVSLRQAAERVWAAERRRVASASEE